MENDNKPVIVEEIAIELIPGWSEREMKLLKDAEVHGSKPIAPTLSAQMFNLFLEGYSCAEIAKQNKGLSEIDILVCRQKFNWDEEKDRYAFDLHKQISEKVIKAKLESIEFLTNSLAVAHKEFKDQQLRYLQSGKPEDKPESWIKSAAQYKAMLENLSKATGEDRTSKQEISASVRVENSTTPIAALHPELQSKLLAKFAKSNEKKGDDNE